MVWEEVEVGNVLEGIIKGRGVIIGFIKIYEGEEGNVLRKVSG